MVLEISTKVATMALKISTKIVWFAIVVNVCGVVINVFDPIYLLIHLWLIFYLVSIIEPPFWTTSGSGVYMMFRSTKSRNDEIAGFPISKDQNFYYWHEGDIITSCSFQDFRLGKYHAAVMMGISVEEVVMYFHHWQKMVEVSNKSRLNEAGAKLWHLTLFRLNRLRLTAWKAFRYATVPTGLGRRLFPLPAWKGIGSSNRARP